MSNTVEAFAALMAKHHVPAGDIGAIGATGYLDKALKGQFFHGIDEAGRVFVNVPIIVVMDDAHFAERDAIRKNGAPNRRERAFTVFQRWENDSNTFATGNEETLMNRDGFLGESYTDLSLLDRLLSGETLRFHEYTYSGKERLADPNEWIDVTLDRPVTA